MPIDTPAASDLPPISAAVREKAPLILAEIQKASSVLLHCHPSPDPDSVGSALAMKFALEQMGKKATVIAGDSVIPDAFMHFPGARDIVAKNFFEVDLKEFDLFIVIDATLGRVSNLAPAVFPEHMTVVNIDHHASNTGGAKIDLIDPSYPAAGQMLYDLFELWNVTLTKEIASDLFIGIYTDTGGFKYAGTTPRSYAAAGKLSGIIGDFTSLISTMENSRQPSELIFLGMALSSVESALGGIMGLAGVSHSELEAHAIPADERSPSSVSPMLRSVRQWKIACALIEAEPGRIKLSFRSHDGNEFDVSKLAGAFHGGGHKAAAGGIIVGRTIAEAKALIVSTAKELYNL